MRLTSKPRLLIIGHSHITCLHEAARAEWLPAVEAINIRTLGLPERVEHDAAFAAIMAATKQKHPDAVCLCLGGNYHNVLGIVENPIPFAVGHSTQGAAPQDRSGRSFIPYTVMLDHFRRHHQFNYTLAKMIYDAFPDATRLYVNPPPPIASWDHIISHPGMFLDKLHLGPAPVALRLQLYRIQTEIMTELAEFAGATFIPSPPETEDEAGFLAPSFQSKDATHGNVAYGATILQILREKGSRLP